MSQIQVGDKVRLRFIEPAQVVRNTNQIYTVVTIPGNQNLEHPFWEFSLAGDLMVVSTPVIIFLIDGAP